MCSICLASKSTHLIHRIIAYHYLPQDYKSRDEFKVEVCICSDLNICRKRTEEWYVAQKMVKEASIPIRSRLGNDDELVLSSPIVEGNWNVVISKPTMSIKEVDFRKWYDCEEDLRCGENKGIIHLVFQLK